MEVEIKIIEDKTGRYENTKSVMVITNCSTTERELLFKLSSAPYSTPESVSKLVSTTDLVVMQEDLGLVEEAFLVNENEAPDV